MENDNVKFKVNLIIFFIAITGIAGYFFLSNKKVENNLSSLILTVPSAMPRIDVSDNKNGGTNGLKTFTFDNFHGSTDISDKFQFQYPADWFNESQYFSPQKIQYYTKYEVKVPIWFDLVLAEIFDFTELKYQIDNSKRRTADTVGKIDGREFKRYDLVDYGSYGVDSAGRVKIFVGPKITIDGANYILVFHWEEKPLAEYMQNNNIEVFNNMLLSLRFFK